MSFHHVSVLLNETVNSLQIEPDGVYVDCTAGGGGHSAAIAEKLGPQGKLIAIDRDPDAIKTLEARFAGNENVTVVHGHFFSIRGILSGLGIGAVNGVMADLGVSSHQLDEAGRGFSFHTDAPLDMRMSKEGLSAYDVVNTYSEEALSRWKHAASDHRIFRARAHR